MSVDAVELLQGLVAIQSLSGSETAASTYLVEQMKALGYQAHVDEVDNAVGVREHPDEDGQITTEIVLLGHIDTVPGDIPVEIKGGNLYGRGSVDAKGPLATFVMAGAKAKLRPGVRLVVVGAVEEEAATSKGAVHIAATRQADLCIIGEPSGWDAVTLGYKGRILFEYTLRQPSGHSAGPGRAVAEYAVDWWNAIAEHAAEFNQQHTGAFDQLLPSLRQIETHSDGLTDTVHAKVGVRLPPDFDIETYKATVRTFAGDAALAIFGDVPAYRAERNSPLVRAFSATFREKGLRPRLKVKTGTSDMNTVAPVWHCPIVAYGPGDSSLDHTAEEHLLLDDYHQAIEQLTKVLEQL